MTRCQALAGVDDDGAALFSADDLLSHRRAKNRIIAARLFRQRKKQTLSALELRLGSLEAVSRLLDEQLKDIEAQNATLVVEMRCTSCSTRGGGGGDDDDDDRSRGVANKRQREAPSIDDSITMVVQPPGPAIIVG